MSLLALAGTNSATGGYEIDNSLKLEADINESLTRSAQDGGDRKKVTISFWTKRTELTSSYEMLILAGVNGSKYSAFGFQIDNSFDFHYYNGGSYEYLLRTNRLFRDTSAWYHIVVSMDTTQGTAANRIKIYVNGVQETSFFTETYPTQNIDTPFNNDSQTYPIEIGSQSVFGVGGIPYSGYLADYYLVDGLQLEPTDFGEFDEDSGIWKPKAYTGSYGTNGFKLEFKSSGSLGADSSGNGNNFTLNNITAADQATDTPTNNFATYNAIMYMFGNTFITEGATKLAKLYQNWITPMPTMGVSKGKWYAEFEFVNTGIDSMVGVVPMGEAGFEGAGVTSSNSYLGQSTNSIGYYGQQGNKYINGSGSSYGNSYVAGDKMAVALDMDNGKVYFAKNNTWQNSGDPTSGSTGTGALNLIQPSETHAISSSIWANNGACLANYGGYTTMSISSAASDENGYGTFEYAPPSGYYALCTKNLEEFG
jgi:hypothetical protein